MAYLLTKAALSGIIVVIVSEVARRSPGAGGLIASLPLVSLLGIIWLWRDTGDVARIAAHAESTFWFVLPSLPMFLAFPAMLRSGMGFGSLWRSPASSPWRFIFAQFGCCRRSELLFEPPKGREHRHVLLSPAFW